MRAFIKCKIDYEVGDIVRFKTDETYRPFKVLEINPRIISDNEKDHISKLMLMAYTNTKVGDEINPCVKIAVLEVGEEKSSWREDIYEAGSEWDADYFEKIELDCIKDLIAYKIEDIADDNKKLNRFQKIKEELEKSLNEKPIDHGNNSKQSKN